MTLLLDNDDIERVLAMRPCMDALDRSRSHTYIPPRRVHGLHSAGPWPQPPTEWFTEDKEP